MYAEGDRVQYAGCMDEVKGMHGVVRGPGTAEGRSLVEWLGLGQTMDMSDTVLEKLDSEAEAMKSYARGQQVKATLSKGSEPEWVTVQSKQTVEVDGSDHVSLLVVKSDGGVVAISALSVVESRPLGKGPRKTRVIHPDGTVSTRKSENNVYIYAIESCEDMWAVAKVKFAKAAEFRKAKATFIEAVRGGKIRLQPDPMGDYPNRVNLYLTHDDGSKWWLGTENGYGDTGPVDRKAAVRERLEGFDRSAATLETEAREAESGPHFRYGVVRWSQSSDAALSALREFERNHAAGTTTFRMVPAEVTE